MRFKPLSMDIHEKENNFNHSRCSEDRTCILGKYLRFSPLLLNPCWNWTSCAMFLVKITLQDFPGQNHRITPLSSALQLHPCCVFERWHFHLIGLIFAPTMCFLTEMFFPIMTGWKSSTNFPQFLSGKRISDLFSEKSRCLWKHSNIKLQKFMEGNPWQVPEFYLQ